MTTKILRMRLLALASGNMVWLRYLLASVLALAADSGLFLLLWQGGMGAMAASAIGYCAGILVHWLVTSRTVFADHAALRGSMQRNRQKALFVVSALAGLAVTTGIVGGGDQLGVDPRIAKLVAIAVSFQLTYMLRRHVVFRG